MATRSGCRVFAAKPLGRSGCCMDGADAAGTCPIKLNRDADCVQQEEIVADGLQAETFMDFKRKFGRGSALTITLECGKEIIVDSCKISRKLPKGNYTAKLLKRASRIPDGIDAEDSTVWMEGLAARTLA